LHLASQPSARPYRHELMEVRWAEPARMRSNTAVGLMMVWFVHRHSRDQGGKPADEIVLEEAG